MQLRGFFISGVKNLYLKDTFPTEYAAMLYNKGKRVSGPNKGGEYPDVKNPEGEVLKVYNAAQFAKHYGLQIPNFHRILTGKALSYKGWTLA